MEKSGWEKGYFNARFDDVVCWFKLEMANLLQGPLAAVALCVVIMLITTCFLSTRLRVLVSSW